MDSIQQPVFYLCLQLHSFISISITKHHPVTSYKQKSDQEHDVVRCPGHQGASAENLQEPGTEGPAGGMNCVAFCTQY